MKKSILFLAMVVFATTAVAQESFINGQRISPCDRWSYDTDSQGYFCQNLPWSITVPTARDVQNVIDSLERKIRDLEARVRQLEAQKS